MVGHLIHRDNFISNIIEEKVKGKRGRRRLRHSYLDQIKEKVAVATFKEVREMAFDRESWA